MDARIVPEGGLEILSRREANQLRDAGEGGLYELWRQCSLAVLNSGAAEDDVRRILSRHENFRIAIVQYEGGVALELKNAPNHAFVGNQMIRGIREHLFVVLRDLLYAYDDIMNSARFDLASSAGITDAVFHILRNAGVLRAHDEPRLVVCWGGHAINREEYDYTKVVGYALGLRGLDICTGCGAGAMKGPMKGATVGHAKQRIRDGRYLGLTEPTIIAAESPNPICNELVILPDMEKRLEAFVRMAHGIVVFPGGVGTAEEILYLLGILLGPENQRERLPLVFTGPQESASYFERLHAFIGETLGPLAQRRYKIILANPDAVAEEITSGLRRVREIRAENDDAYFFNWPLKIGLDFQMPFNATHETMAALQLHPNQPVHSLAVNLRRAFSGIVAGNVREAGIRLVEEHGPFELRGDRRILAALDRLLEDFVAQRRMRLSDPTQYVRCYRIAA
ncbi:MAG TPA: nucleotide 5'-monophosphate nucleosidase PpnN [Gammaproteobacteria bacterium]|nr:nucleotide 5'-monophosphate nucleosidase PpnN [Gammaproteobacteria bacterium]